MITAIEIENLRGIRAGKLEGLAPLTLLTGPNSCGKSTVLEALLIATSPNPSEAVGQAVYRHQTVYGGARWLFRFEERQARVEARTETIGESAPALEVRQLEWSEQCDEEARKELFQRGSPAPYSTILWQDKYPEPDAGSGWTAFGADNRYWMRLEAGRRIGTLPPVHLVDPGSPVALDVAFSEAKRIGRLDAVHELLALLLPGFERLEILVLRNHTYGLHVTRNGRSVPVGLSGDGIQAFVQIALEVALTPGGLALVEEPEVFQHPKAIWQTAKALLANARRGVQTVITTHSLELIDALLGESSQGDRDAMALFHMVLEDGELRWGRRSGDDISFARMTLESDLR